MPRRQSRLPFAALLLSFCCAGLGNAALADEASLERAAQAQPEAPKADSGAVAFNPATYVATGAPRSLLVHLPQAAARPKPRRSTSG